MSTHHDSIPRLEDEQMDHIEEKLISCFLEVMPELSRAEIPHASAGASTNWDSVTTVSLIAVIEDEFGIAIEIDELSSFDSFQGVLQYLKRRTTKDSVAVDCA